MSVEQTNTIDFIGTSQSDEIILTISDHLPWDEGNEHLLLLQDKLNSYLRFIESGEMIKSYPSAKDKPIAIQIVMKFAPTGDASTFLNRCKETTEKAGYRFDWKTID